MYTLTNLTTETEISKHKTLTEAQYARDLYLEKMSRERNGGNLDFTAIRGDEKILMTKEANMAKELYLSQIVEMI